MLSKSFLPVFAVLIYGIGKVYGGAYCAKVCDNDDPCGNGKAQQTTCASPNITDWETFGLNGEHNFVGCSKAVCEAECANMNATLPMDNQNGTFCFSMERNMFPDEDLAELSAVARGCDGSHFMTAMGLFMVGSYHTACDESYSEVGLAFTSAESEITSAGSKVALMAVSFAVSAVCLFAL